MAGNAVAKPEDSLALVTGRTLPEIEDRDQASAAIAAQILAAPDLAALFKDRSTVATRELVGKALRVNDVRLMRSTLKDKDGVWMLIDAVDLDTGELIGVNTGSRNIMAILYRAKQLNVLPIEVAVIQVNEGRPGESAALGLKPVGATAEAAGLTPA